jgi:hypothetical protein
LPLTVEPPVPAGTAASMFVLGTRTGGRARWETPSRRWPRHPTLATSQAMAGMPIRRARKGPITLTDGTVVGLSEADASARRPLSCAVARPVARGEDRAATRPQPRSDGRDHVPAVGRMRCRVARHQDSVLCVFWAIGANMIRSLAEGTLDYAAACGRARQRDEARDSDGVARRLAEREGAGPPPLTRRPVRENPGLRSGWPRKFGPPSQTAADFSGVTAPAMRMRLRGP